MNLDIKKGTINIQFDVIVKWCQFLLSKLQLINLGTATLNLCNFMSAFNSLTTYSKSTDFTLLPNNGLVKGVSISLQKLFN